MSKLHTPMKVIRIVPVLLTVMLFISSCSRDDKNDTPSNTPNQPTAATEATHTLLELIDEYGGKEIKDPGIAVTGTVISSDEEGNVKNQLFLRDDTGALFISINGTKLFETYPLDAEVLVQCTGLKVDADNRSLTTATGDPLVFNGTEGIITKTGNTNFYSTTNLNPEDISIEDLNHNFHAFGYQFDEDVVGESYILNNQTTIRTVRSIEGKEVKLVFEPGSAFEGETIPTKQGPVNGLLVKQDGGFVLKPVSLDDLAYTFDRTAPFEKQTFSFNGNTLPYQIMFPRNYDPNGSYPLVVFLHGAGERGSNNTSQMAYGPKTFGSYDARTDYPAIVIFPQCPSDIMWSRRAKYDQNGQLIFEFPVEQNPNSAMELVIELVRTTMANEAVDDKRIYVSGLSMGGIGVFEFCYYAPDLPAAAISLAGGHDSSFVSSYGTNIDFRLYHGANDNVVPPRYSQEMHAGFQKNGFQSEYFEAPGRGHEWNYVLNDPDYIQWMFSRSR